MKTSSPIIFCFFILTVLKLLGVGFLESWSWWAVTFPFWFIPGFALVLFLPVALFFIIMWTGKYVADLLDRD